MNGPRFDSLARAMAGKQSRRQVISTLLACVAAFASPPCGARGQLAGALGEQCTAHDECSAVAAGTGWATCRGNVCCLVRGSRCSHDGECCDGERCLPPGFCGGVGASGLAPGAWCPAGANLCSLHPYYGRVSAICADNGIWEDGPTNCCFPAGGFCHGDAECCAGLVCGGNACA
jgi:hypothetical protein